MADKADSTTLPDRQLTQPAASPCGNPHAATRRSALRGAAATVLAAVAVPLPALAARVDAHIAWDAEWQNLLAWCDGPEPGARDLDDCPPWHRMLELETLISTTPAAPMPGVLVQMRLMHFFVTKYGSLGEDGEAGIGNALATVEQLAGSTVHG